jgi:hypothetical protein
MPRLKPANIFGQLAEDFLRRFSSASAPAPGWLVGQARAGNDAASQPRQAAPVHERRGEFGQRSVRVFVEPPHEARVKVGNQPDSRFKAC